jgi:hypothetical protein
MGIRQEKGLEWKQTINNYLKILEGDRIESI